MPGGFHRICGGRKRANEGSDFGKERGFEVRELELGFWDEEDGRESGFRGRGRVGSERERREPLAAGRGGRERGVVF